jgi:transcriptional regulator with XRE-family HTH domain
MDANTDPTVGMNVRRARRFAGLTLQELADRIGKSKGWLSLIENGHLRLEKRQDIAAIADVLGVSADTLLGQPTPEITPGGNAYNLKPLRAVLLDASISDAPDILARPVAQLGRAVTDMDAALRVADYAAMYRDLPDLLGELQVHAATSKGQDRDEALRLLVQASSSAMIMLRHFGRTDLAWVAADRGRQAAVLLGDPAWSAAAAFEVAHARPSVNLPRSLLATPRLADEFEPLTGDDPFRREVYGMLRLSAALACAVQGDHEGASAQGAEAARVAEPLGDRPEAFELFGPANVGVWRTSLAVEAGNAEAALAFADHVQPTALASKNRRAALRLERARAFGMLDRDRDAVVELRHAERLSPAQVRNNPLVRDMVVSMLDRAQREAGGRDLRGLAWRMGVIRSA